MPLMDLLDRLLAHDAWTTRQLLEICAMLSNKQLDREFDIGHRTLRTTFNHIIHNMEVWSAAMAGQDFQRQPDRSVSGLIRRLDKAAARFQAVARGVADRNGWDEIWVDRSGQQKRYGTAIAHLITHSMHHRAQALYLLRLTGVTNLPEGDVFSWENSLESSL
jgi:uncharacterized damage-inducible protein DinB